MSPTATGTVIAGQIIFGYISIMLYTSRQSQVTRVRSFGLSISPTVGLTFYLDSQDILMIADIQSPV